MPKPAPRRAKDDYSRGRPTAAGHRPSVDPAAYAARARRARRAVVHAVLAVGFVGGVAWAVGEVRLAIARSSAEAADPPAVVFANRPAWMTDLVAKQLAESFRPAGAVSVFDRQALVDVTGRLRANPWVAKVRQVRRAFAESAGDTIEVDCDFRTPAALVYDNDGHYWFVDEKGVKLPEWFAAKELDQLVFAADKRVNLRVIDGVRNPPPRQAGQLWLGDDLIAGLDLARQLSGQPFAEDVVRVNVANYAGRADGREAHLVLVTKYGTEVRWGRPVNASDAFIEVKPERKLSAMRQIVAQFGRVDAGKPWIDVRFDTVTYPVARPATQDGGHADGWR